MTIEQSVFARRSDLDALRAGAMLLGIALHASLSFFPSFWMVTDSRQSSGFVILFSAIHGFRMPLFFVLCGFFSALLLHRRGHWALVKHRFQRVLLPLLLGMATLVPATNWISGFAMSSAASKTSQVAATDGESNLFAAVRAGNLEAIARHLANGVSVNGVDPERGGTPLLWAAVTGQADAIELLVERGADVNATDRDGGTALHAATFMGHAKAVEVLLRRGANVNAVNRRGDTPYDVAVLDEGTTRYFASLLQLELNEENLGSRKAAITESLRQHGATAGSRSSGVADLLMQMPLFHHLWFLWFLWWLVVCYAALSVVGANLPSIRWLTPFVLSPARYVWLVPLTMIPQWFMGEGDGLASFGPDTSSGLLPIPRVFAYYAIFFGFGVFYYKCDRDESDDTSDRVGHRWWLPLAIGLGVVLPLGLSLMEGTTGSWQLELEPHTRRVFVVFLQAYPWLMTFGLMGLFRRFCSVENPSIRYLSDSAYWLYLAHLPLIIAAQHVVRAWPIPAVAKFLLIVVVVTFFLLFTYQTLVRHTWLGRLLNGPRSVNNSRQ